MMLATLIRLDGGAFGSSKISLSTDSASLIIAGNRPSACALTFSLASRNAFANSGIFNQRCSVIAEIPALCAVARKLLQLSSAAIAASCFRPRFEPCPLMIHQS
jgi:hypothetical protein